MQTGLMRAMILAAGRGERMRPLTDHTPKPLLKIGNKPLIVWHLESLSKAGFKEIVINHAHLGSQIESTLGDGSLWGLNIKYSAENVALETAGGIANALHLLGDYPFLVLNSDIFTDIDFSTLRHPTNLTANMLAHLVLVDNPPQHPQGDFAIQQKLLQNAGEKMYTFSGIGVYHPDLFSSIPRGTPAKLAPLLREAISQERASAEYFSGIWHDIGTPERLITLNAELQKN